MPYMEHMGPVKNCNSLVEIANIRSNKYPPTLYHQQQNGNRILPPSYIFSDEKYRKICNNLSISSWHKKTTCTLCPIIMSGSI